MDDGGGENEDIIAPAAAAVRIHQVFRIYTANHFYLFNLTHSS